jgi:hypothetical protein
VQDTSRRDRTGDQSGVSRFLLVQAARYVIKII